MKVFAIADLHLLSSGEKPMDVFGPEWQDHPRTIARNWRQSVEAQDVVLLCGDLSWAMTLDEARPDLAFIDSLPGRKYFIRGNHDYWFSGPGKVAAAVGPTMHVIRFGAAAADGVGVCGVRGWRWPGQPDFDPATDERHWRRALIRLDLSLKALARLEWDVAVAMLHYPPLSASAASEICDRLAEAGVRHCVYGHVHGEDARQAFEGIRDGVHYRCVSADHVGFAPALVLER
jgi:predicted phosphohydrolase